MRKFASILGLGLIGVGVVQLLRGSFGVPSFLALSVVGFLLFINESVEEIALGILKIKQNLRRAEQMSEEIRALARPLVDCLYLYIGTSNLHPPGRTVEGSIRDRVLRLAGLACPNEEERQNWIAGLDAQVETAQRVWPDRDG
jgi:hypothetical protein